MCAIVLMVSFISCVSGYQSKSFLNDSVLINKGSASFLNVSSCPSNLNIDLNKRFGTYICRRLLYGKPAIKLSIISVVLIDMSSAIKYVFLAMLGFLITFIIAEIRFSIDIKFLGDLSALKGIIRSDLVTL